MLHFICNYVYIYVQYLKPKSFLMCTCIFFNSFFFSRRKKREKNNHHTANSVEDPHRSMCRLRYQQTTVDVYASFCILENGKLQYYTGKKTYLRVTDLLKDRLKMSDPRIASLNGNVIVGQAPGLTEIQVGVPLFHLFHLLTDLSPLIC